MQRLDVDGSTRWFTSTAPLPAPLIAETMDRVGRHTAELTDLAQRDAMSIDGLSCYGPAAGLPRSPLVALNVAGVNPFALAEDLSREGVEARAGCHCATLAHRALGLIPPASCRLSFALYNSRDDVTCAMDAVRRVTDRLRRPGRRAGRPGDDPTRRGNVWCSTSAAKTVSE